MSEFVSVIVCTYNRDHLISRTLESLSRQTLSRDKFEVIVVDDGSEDNTREVCDAMAQQLPNMRFIRSLQNLGTGGAANLGLQLAKGAYILFTDDDCIVAKDWVERMKKALNEEAIVAGAIASPVSHYIQLCHNIAQFGPFSPGGKAGECEFIAGANMGFRHSVLEELKGFETEKSCYPDMELVLRAREKGYRIFFEPGAVVTHDPERNSLKEVFEYASKHAAGTILLRHRYRKLLNTPVILRSPALILMTSPLIAFILVFQYYSRSRDLIRYPLTLPLVYALKISWCLGAARGLRNCGMLFKK